MSTEQAPQWITFADASERFGLSFVTLHHWRRRGCPLLGRKLRCKTQRRTVRASRPFERPVWLVFVPDVERLAELPPFTGEYVDAAGVWLSTRLARERFGLSADRLASWRTGGCAALDGKKLRSQRVTVLILAGSKRACYRRLVYRLEDLARIAAGAPEDESWLTAAEVKGRYGHSTMTLWLWRTKGCPHLGGRKLRSKLDRRAIRREGCKKRSHDTDQRSRVFALADLEEVARQDKPDPAASADPDWLTYREAAQRYGVTQPRLSDWARSDCPLLGRPIATKMARAGVGNRVMTVTKYARADLKEIARRRSGAEEAPATEVDASQEERHRPGRGRIQGSQNRDTQARHKRVIEAAKSGQYHNIAELARAQQRDRTTVSKILKEAGVEVVKPTPAGA